MTFYFIPLPQSFFDHRLYFGFTMRTLACMGMQTDDIALLYSSDSAGRVAGVHAYGRALGIPYVYDNCSVVDLTLLVVPGPQPLISGHACMTICRVLDKPHQIASGYCWYLLEKLPQLKIYQRGSISWEKGI
jgi:hypothetical protein